MLARSMSMNKGFDNIVFKSIKTLLELELFLFNISISFLLAAELYLPLMGSEINNVNIVTQIEIIETSL